MSIWSQLEAEKAFGQARRRAAGAVLQRIEVQVELLA